MQNIDGQNKEYLMSMMQQKRQLQDQEKLYFEVAKNSRKIEAFIEKQDRSLKDKYDDFKVVNDKRVRRQILDEGYQQSLKLAIES